MFEIAKEFRFEASHQLMHLPESHKCSRLHGHSYRVVLIFRSGSLNYQGFVIDYGALQPFKNWIADNVDHRHLNDLPYFKDNRLPTSAEHLAKLFYQEAAKRWPETVACRVYETAKTWAEYTP